jgi:hypothetical protein
MKFVKFMPALVLAGAMLASAGAHADQTFTIGQLGSTVYVNSNTVTAGAEFTLPSTGSTPYNFTDTYDFFVLDNPALAGTSVTVNLDLGNVGFHISNLKLDLIQDLDNDLVVDAGEWVIGDLAVSGETAVSVTTPINAGDYFFLVRGLADGETTKQGIYTFSTFTQPVPEAETYSMLLAGLGLVGFMVSRRRAAR